MSDEGVVQKGFTQVDRMPDPAVLVAAMDATAQWQAVRTLRQWERGQLEVSPGHAVLDVGCGTGDVTLEMARAAGPQGQAVGIDPSEQMLSAARDRAEAAGIAADFRAGDAAALDLADDTFDRVRSERTLQWVASPVDAVREMTRVTRPGGRICLIDSDWRTLIIDHPMPPVARRFMEAVAAARGESMNVGGQLVNLLRDAGATDVAFTAATHIWHEWNPDASPNPGGFLPLRMVAADLVATGALDEQTAEDAVGLIEDAARRDRFFMSLTMFAATGVVS